MLHFQMNFKSIFFLLLFRPSFYFANSGRILKIIGLPYRIIYHFFVQWILGIDIPDRVRIGKDFELWHGQGLVVHPDTIIGDKVTLRHNTTIGQKKRNERPPIIGSNVDVGAHCIIIGDIIIGDNVVIGAGSFINKNVPANTIVYGNPMIIKSNKL